MMETWTLVTATHGTVKYSILIVRVFYWQFTDCSTVVTLIRTTVSSWSSGFDQYLTMSPLDLQSRLAF